MVLRQAPSCVAMHKPHPHPADALRSCSKDCRFSPHSRKSPNSAHVRLLITQSRHSIEVSNRSLNPLGKIPSLVVNNEIEIYEHETHFFSPRTSQQGNFPTTHPIPQIAQSLPVEYCEVRFSLVNPAQENPSQAIIALKKINNSSGKHDVFFIGRAPRT